jgi:hypothetical protein
MPTTQINGSIQIQPGTIDHTRLTSAAGILLGQLAQGSLLILSNGSVAFTANQSLGGFVLTNSGSPVAASDVANKSYVDTLVNGKDWKESCRVASTADIAVSSAPAAVDGVTLNSGDRVLLKNQTTGSENGLYTFNGGGTALTRTADGAQGELTSQATVFISEGTSNAGTEWNLTTPDPITVGTTAQSWVQSGSAAAYSGSNGIIVSGTVISPAYGNTVNTVCQGNDPRLSDARTPVGTTLTSAQIWVGSAANVAAAVVLSGDATLSDVGALTLSPDVAKLSRKVTRETPTGAVNGSNMIFTLANTITAGTEEVYLNGIQQDAGAGNDYTISGAAITMSAAPASGDKIRVSYWK